MSAADATPDRPRHPGVLAALKRLESDFKQPTPEQMTAAQELREKYEDFALDLADQLPDSSELTHALTLLWESKNYAVYLALTQ